MVGFVNQQSYSKSIDTNFSAKPRQPIWGSINTFTEAAVTIFEYDLQAPYGSGAFVVSNPSQTTHKMVAWGMIARVALIAPQNLLLTIFADLWNGTFTQIDTSPIAITASAKVQIITIPAIPCFQIRGQLQSVSVAANVIYHTSCTDY